MNLWIWFIATPLKLRIHSFIFHATISLDWSLYDLISIFVVGLERRRFRDDPQSVCWWDNISETLFHYHWSVLRNNSGNKDVRAHLHAANSSCLFWYIKFQNRMIFLCHLFFFEEYKVFLITHEIGQTELAMFSLYWRSVCCRFHGKNSSFGFPASKNMDQQS